MKKLPVLVSGLSLVGLVAAGAWAGGGRQQIGTSAAQTGWTLAFSDEFGGSSIDTAKWNVSNAKSPRNNEENCYTTEDAYVSGGTLVLRQQKRNWTDPSGRPCPYTSGQLISKNYVVNQSVMKLEIRVQAPAGKGLHSAYWTFHACDFGQGDCASGAWLWPPEIDLLEVINTTNTAYFDWHSVPAGLYESSMRFVGNP